MLTLPGGVPRCLPRRLVLPSRPLLAQLPYNTPRREIHLRKTAFGSRRKPTGGKRTGLTPAVKVWRGHGAGDRLDYWAKRPQVFRRETHPGQVKANARRKWLAEKRPAASSLEAEYWDNLDELTKYSNLARRQKEKEHEGTEAKTAATPDSPLRTEQKAKDFKTGEGLESFNEGQAKIVELKAKLAQLEALLNRKAASVVTKPVAGTQKQDGLRTERSATAEGPGRSDKETLALSGPGHQKVSGRDGGRSEPTEEADLRSANGTASGSSMNPNTRQQNSQERRRELYPATAENGARMHGTSNVEDQHSTISKLTAEGKLGDHMKRQEPIKQLTRDEIAMFQRAAEESSLKMPRSPINTLRTDAKNSDGAISILEELFPRELGRKSSTGKPQRHVPKAPLDLPAMEAVEITGAEESPSKHAQDTLFSDEDISPKKPPKACLDDKLTVLVLRKASKHLTQDDFQRLMPGGRHIEGWSNRGRLIRVIRARKTDSLELTGDYFLVFSNTAIASAYLEHTNQQHRHSKASSPRSFYGSIPLPPSLSPSPGKKNKFDAPVYTYNLAPPSHDLTMRLVPQPFSPLMRQVVLGSGYPELMENKQSDHEVLLWFTSYRLPSFSVVRRAIDQDGKQRGSFWQTVGRNSGIRILGADALEAVPRSDAQTRNDDGMSADGRTIDDGKSGDGTSQRRLGAEKTRQFIISFKDREEASRFVLAWHRRDVTKLVEMQLLAPWRSAPILGNAELTW